MPSVRHDVSLLTPAEQGAYQELVGCAPCSRLTHSLAWRDALAGEGLGEPVYWLAWRNGVLRGALPAFVRRTPVGAIVNSLPLVQSTGGVVCAPDVGQEEQADLRHTLGTALLDWCRREGVGVACVVGPAFVHDPDDGWPQPPSFVVSRTVRALDLQEPLTYSPFVQRNIKKAGRFEPLLREARSTEEARLVHGMYAENMRGLGVEPMGWDFFAQVRAASRAGSEPRFVWAEVGGQPAAGLILMWHGQVVDYYGVGTTALGRATQAGSWLCDQMIRTARAAGLRWWNWMASPNPSVYDFKKRWGGQDRSYAIRGWILGDPRPWRTQTPAQLRGCYPGYFVLPYDQLAA